MFTILRKTETNISLCLHSAFEKYHKYFSEVFISSKKSDRDALLEHKELALKEDAFFYLVDNFKLTDVAWSNVIVQSILKTPVVFVSKYAVERNIIYLNKGSYQLREVIENPEFFVSTGVYILTPEIYNFIDSGQDIDVIIKSWAKMNRKKVRGSREKSNIAVFPIEGWESNVKKRPT